MSYLEILAYQLRGELKLVAYALVFFIITLVIAHVV